ncbi:MAG: ATP-binding protein [Desulfuromonadales bacterium]|nr:ATP-binding protein [Desulfuromonadales bacterium]
MNLLIVEDNPGHRELLGRHLRNAFVAADIGMAPTLAVAREMITVLCPDLALVDLQLPDGQGTELLADRTSLGSFPVVIMTSQGDEHAAVEAIKGGASDYVVKSERTFADIGRVVERALRDWRNLCARQMAEDELRRSEAKYRRLTQEFQALLEGISDAIALVDPQMRLVWANRVAIEAAAAGSKMQTGIHCHDLWHGCDETCSDCPVIKTFQTGRPAEVVRELPSGRVWGKRSFPLKNPDGSVANVIILATDITEKIQLRAESMRSSQLAALGELSAGVAHEINNPLNGIINYAQLLLDRDLPREEHEFAQNIINEGHRVAEIVSNLLTFSRKPPEEPHPLSLAEALHGVLKLTAVNLRHENILLEIDIAPDLPPVIGHYQQLQQVLLNVIGNACYALNQKYPGYDPHKRLLIKMHLVEDEGPCWLRTSITDYGIGIPADLIDKVCDPFYTSKPQGAGTGLGMSISHGIVTAHHGRLLLSSSPGAWTKVVIELPCSKETEVMS